MTSTPDTWEKPRTHGQHLTGAEINYIKECFVLGCSYRAVAEKLKCSSRVVSTHYSYFKAEGIRRRVISLRRDRA